MNKTKIEWVRNPDGSLGYTWNPITGCLNHLKGLCKDGGFPCYAYRLAHGRLKPLYLENTRLAYTGLGGAYTKALTDPFYPRFWDNRLAELDKLLNPYTEPKGKGIFVCDMSDLFGIGIPEEWTGRVLEVIKHNPWHRFYLLTKQPQNLAAWSPFPDNCYVGVTATTDQHYYHAVEHLCLISAKVKFISFEPLLAPIFHGIHASINWVIIGTQTKPYKPPKIEWVQEIVEAADNAGAKVFLKDNLHPLLSKETATTFHRVYPDYCELRQEMPAEEVKQCKGS